MDTNTHKTIYTFQCPICSKYIRFEQPGEPCCTGPSESRDEHEFTVMLLTSTTRVPQVDPEYAKQRSVGPLIILP